MLASAGPRPFPTHGHLDDENQLIAARILENWEAQTGKPRVGEFLRLPDGSMKRFCNNTGDGQQLTKGGSFYIGRFWFFSHDQAGAGRGVDVFLPCRIYELVDYSMAREKAEAHPSAISCREFWGAEISDYQNRVEALMRGELR